MMHLSEKFPLHFASILINAVGNFICRLSFCRECRGGYHVDEQCPSHAVESQAEVCSYFKLYNYEGCPESSRTLPIKRAARIID